MNLLVSCFITSLVYKRKLQKMELRWSHIVHLYNVYLENKDSGNCAQLLEKEFNKTYGIKTLDDGHDCNIASMNSLNIHDVNDECISHDNDEQYETTSIPFFVVFFYKPN